MSEARFEEYIVPRESEMKMNNRRDKSKTPKILPFVATLDQHSTMCLISTKTQIDSSP
jgi:hypothetical protein